MIITSGLYKGRKIIAPEDKITRPTLSKVRMGIFNMLYSVIGDFSDKTFLDLFGGSGIMGLEALSRGFKHVTVCEINHKAAAIIAKNYKQLDLKPDLINCNSLDFIKKTKNIYDVIYIDPPYESGIYEKVMSKINSGLLIVEHSEKLNTLDFTIIKEKNYGGKIVTVLKKI